MARFYRAGLGGLELCRELAGLFHPIHGRRCFNCTHAGSITLRDINERIPHRDNLLVIAKSSVKQDAFSTLAIQTASCSPESFS